MRVTVGVLCVQAFTEISPIFDGTPGHYMGIRRGYAGNVYYRAGSKVLVHKRICMVVCIMHMDIFVLLGNRIHVHV